MAEEEIARVLAMGAFAAMVAGTIYIARLIWRRRSVLISNLRAGLSGRMLWAFLFVLALWLLFIFDYVRWGRYGTEPGDGGVGLLSLFAIGLGPLAAPVLAVSLPVFVCYLAMRHPENR